jgi:3-methyladenine DNA glycosylase AlkC
MEAAIESDRSLKEIFGDRRGKQIAAEVSAACPEFQRERFLDFILCELEGLSLMARMRRLAEALRVALPPDFERNVVALMRVAPRIESKFATLIFPEYVGIAGGAHFEMSMDALRYFTSFGSSEFAIDTSFRRPLCPEVRNREEGLQIKNIEACPGADYVNPPIAGHSGLYDP